MCNIGSCEISRFSTKTTPVARKEHICCECDSIIAIGQRYENFRGLWDKFETYKTCLFCAGVRDQAYSDFDLLPNEGIVFGELWSCVVYDYIVQRNGSEKDRN